MTTTDTYNGRTLTHYLPMQVVGDVLIPEQPTAPPLWFEAIRVDGARITRMLHSDDPAHDLFHLLRSVGGAKLHIWPTLHIVYDGELWQMPSFAVGVFGADGGRLRCYLLYAPNVETAMAETARLLRINRVATYRLMGVATDGTGELVEQPTTDMHPACGLPFERDCTTFASDQPPGMATSPAVLPGGSPPHRRPITGALVAAPPPRRSLERYNSPLPPPQQLGWHDWLVHITHATGQFARRLIRI